MQCQASVLCTEIPSLPWSVWSDLQQHWGQEGSQGFQKEIRTLCSRFHWQNKLCSVSAWGTLHFFSIYHPLYLWLSSEHAGLYFPPTTDALTFNHYFKHLTALIHISVEEDIGFSVNKNLCIKKSGWGWVWDEMLTFFWKKNIGN